MPALLRLLGVGLGGGCQPPGVVVPNYLGSKTVRELIPSAGEIYGSFMRSLRI